MGAPPPGSTRRLAVEPPKASDLEQQRSELQRLAPKNFKTWMKAFQAGADEYAANEADSLSVGAHPAATAFRMFLNFHARGRLLDVGCGPQPVPSYLENYPLDQIAGIDPLAPTGVHPFAFARSHAEFLPWDDGSFDTVVSATSIDHVYLLDRSIEEFARVLSPKGILLVWTGLFDQSERYDPYTRALRPRDQYHLFHPGKSWFTSEFESHFRLDETHNHNPINTFLAFSKR